MNRGLGIVALSLALCLASGLGAVPAARALRVKCDKSPYDVDLAVVYANGMFTTLEVAKANLERLRPLVDEKLKLEFKLEPYAATYAIAYNKKEGVFESIRRVVKERVAMTGSNLIRILSGLDPLPDWLDEQLNRYAAELDEAGFDDDDDLEQHVQMYRDHLRSGHKVLVIAHSEGNLYANAAYRRLFQTALPTPGERDFGIVGIALPAPTLAGWQPPGCPVLGCYTTLSEDLIIRGVHSQLGDTAPPNVSGASPLPSRTDLFWHGLTETYLETKEAREQILNHVAAFVHAFEPLEATLNDSTVTASLEWDSTADLDLHVFEQFASHHVYGDFRDGVGKLDLDDQDGYGPEHYYTECAELEGGDFRFAVGYYDGEGPATARLRIKIGQTARTYKHVLAEALHDTSTRDPETFVVLHVVNRADDESGKNIVDGHKQLIDDYDIELQGSVPSQ